jgi:DNA-binding beta-propeller fold protein YncE
VCASALAASALVAAPPGVARASAGWTGLVTNDDTLADTLTPFDTSTGSAGAAFATAGGGAPSNVTFTSDGTKAYAVELRIGQDGEIIPVDVAGSGFIARAPLVLPGATSSSEICTANNFNFFNGPGGIALTPDGAKAFVTDLATDSVYPVNLAASPIRPMRPIRLGLPRERCRWGSRPLRMAARS